MLSCHFSFTFILLFCLFCEITAFNFNFNPPSECDDLGLTWSGGTPPFQLLMIPVYGSPRSFDIPNSVFSNGNGSYTVQVPFKKDQQMLFTMSDAGGFNSGVSSNVYTVSQSKGGSCNSTDPGVAFVFQLNSALQQCRPFLFSGYDAAVQPVTIGVVVPGGTAFTISPPVGSTSYEWTANVARGTSLVFFMTDSRGHQGGSSDLRTVGVSDDNTCLSSHSPSSTSSPPGPSQTASAPSPPPTTSSSSPISAAGIAGAIVGTALFLAVVVTLVLFIIKRKNSATTARKRIFSQIDISDNPNDASHMRPYGLQPPDQFASHPPSHPHSSSSYLESTASHPASVYPGSMYNSPISYQPSQTHYPPQPGNQNQHLPPFPPVDVFSPSAALSPSTEYSPHPYQNARPTTQHSSLGDSGNNSTTTRKTEKAGISPNTPSRFIVHTDVEDVLHPNEDGVIELPPQYSESRAPVRLGPPAVPPSDTKYRP